MNNGSLPIKGNNSRTTTSITDPSLRASLIRTSNQDTPLDLTDVSILSVGLTRFQHHDHGMLTDDDDDNEIIETSDEEDDDDDDQRFANHSRTTLLNNTNHNSDDMDLDLIDPDTQAKLAAILEATGITNSPIPEDFWRDQQVVRLLTSSVTNNLNDLHEIANAMSSSAANLSSHQDKSSKSISKDTSEAFVRACVDNDIHTVEKILQTTNGKEHLNDVNEDGDSVLALACSNGHTDLVRLLLTTIPDIDIDDRGTKQDCTPLMEACNAGHYEIVELLLQHNANVNMQSTSGNTALHYSAGGGYADIVRLLLEHGAKVEETNENGHTPLMEAASGGHVEVARALLDHGAGVNTHSNDSKDKNGNDSKQHKTDEMHTALMEACMDGHVQVAKLLLDHGADVNMPPDSYESPLTLSACGGHIELASLLIERGANLEEVNDEGYTPLMEASREGHDDLVNLLVSRGADVNRTTDDTQETALTLACAGGFLDVAKILISHGANVNLGQSTPLMEASQEGHTELVQYLIQNNADVNQTTSAGETALAYACESGRTEVAEILLNSGAHIDQTENEGRTPLMKAVRAGHTCTVRYLISKGADVNRSTNSNDSTVLSLACAGGHLEVTALLLKHGSDPNHLLKDRSNCLIEAAKGGHTEIVKLLLEYPKSVTQRTSTINSIEPLTSIDNGEGEEDGSTSVTPNSVSGDNKQSSQTPNSSIQLLKSLQKIVPRNILDVLQTGVNESIKLHTDNETKDNSTQSWSTNNIRSSSPHLIDDKCQPVSTSTNPNPEVINIQQAKKLQILEQLQHVEKELHDKAQQHLKINQEYRQHVNEYVLSNPTLPSSSSSSSSTATTGKKKRTTSSSSTSSSSSATSSSSSAAKHDEQLSTNLPLSLLPQTINFFSSPTTELNSSTSTNLRLSNKSNLPTSHHSQYQHKTKKSFNRQLTKFDRRLEQHLHDNQANLDEMNLHFTNLKLLSSTQSPTSSPLSSSDCLTVSSPSKMSMHINTDTQKALEHLRELASNPSALEQIQTLTNNPNLMHQIKKIANQSFIEQLKTLPPFAPANLSHTTNESTSPSTIENKPSNENHEQIETHVEPVTLSRSNSTVQSVIPFPQQQQQQQSSTIQSSIKENIQQSTLANDLPSPPSLPNGTNVSHSMCCSECPSHGSTILNTTLSHLRFQNRINVDCETESNRDTALTLSCAGGHEELVSLLLQRGANIEHRDKKGFTPLILAATAGHANIVARLLDNGAVIEAQSERTKDTALSLACSGGRQEVVEVLLKKGANREHRNVSDYTALSLAASGGYVNIIRLLLNYGAEINSRTGSKLGITPLMLASMNGHVAAVKLLLDMGSDINAQIETNRNTALTLACFQGRAEVVSLLVDRKANIEHRAKTGLTPLMESASGGYVDVGRVLLERGADVNALPVPTSKDTALTIAADKGHHKFVELLLLYGATIDVRNKKGATPLWLACNNGHLEAVQLLVSRFADPDSSDSRKVSCLMAAFRKGHTKVVKYLVRQVRQFPSDADCRRLISTITDKDLLKKCQACMDQIISAKERQAAEANKAANSLLKEIDLEKTREETRKVAAAKKREKRKAKKKGKQKSTAQTDEQRQQQEIEEAEEEHNENEEPFHEGIPPPLETTAVAILVVDDDLRLKMLTSENEQVSRKSPPPEPVTSTPLLPPTSLPPPTPSVAVSKQPTNSNNKKKTSTMTRKIERHQENLASKSKQQETSSTASTATAPIVDDGWQEVIGKQKKITIPHEHYLRIVGRSGSNLNALREVTGASIDVENKRAAGDKTILIKGNGDSIKHAYQLLTALLKDADTDLMNLLSSNTESQKTKSRSTTVTSTNENNNSEEKTKTQRASSTNYGSRLQNNDLSTPETHASTPSSKSTMSNSRSSSKKVATTNSTRSTSSSSSSVAKTYQPLTATGATWVNSNRLNRGASSSSTTNSSALNMTITAWNHPQIPSKSPSVHNKTLNASSSAYHNSYSNMNSSNNHSNYGYTSKQGTTSSKPYTTNHQQKADYTSTNETTLVHPPLTPLIPSQPGVRMPILSTLSTTSDSVPSALLSASSSSLLVVSSATPTPANVSQPGEYNPFASNILTTSIVDVLTKTREPTTSADESNLSSSTKMNFANVAKMNMPTKATHQESIAVTVNEPNSQPPPPDPKIAPGYRGPSSTGTTPVHHQHQCQQPQPIIHSTNYDSLSPTSQLSRAPGANRHQQSISPSMNKVRLDQNGHTGSSTASSTSSSPSSIKQQTNQLIPPQQLFTSVDQQQQQPFGPIGAHRPAMPLTTDVSCTDSPLQMRAKFSRTLSANSTPMYQQVIQPTSSSSQPPPLSSMTLNNPAYANMSRSRSNLNPSAPEFQHCNRLPSPFMPTPLVPPTLPPQATISNGPLSANIMNIVRMMEQKQQQQQQQQQQLYPNNPTMPVPPLPVQPVIAPQVMTPPRLLQPVDMEAMQQHVQNQVLHFWRPPLNQQQMVQPTPPPPQLLTTLQIANILASKGQLPQDPNQAAALVAAYYTNLISRTQQQQQQQQQQQPPPPPHQPNNIPASSNVNKVVYETINTQPVVPSNSDDVPLKTVDSINGQAKAQVIVDPNVILANSNHSTGPSSSASSTANVDHKMIPAAIGSERKRHIPASAINGPMPVAGANDWSSAQKQSYPIDPYLQQQQSQVSLSCEYQQQQPSRDYTR
ncbi:unnamed protein product [Adineta ricciae]|uniref:K Homology domain-containing protein n=1 Tax=Adineta ricciae TaxID=249248 RepID=A0A815HQP7_ADIRI|nr:unnamed protein product [Adineta ricciae]